MTSPGKLRQKEKGRQEKMRRKSSNTAVKNDPSPSEEDSDNEIIGRDYRARLAQLSKASEQTAKLPWVSIQPSQASAAQQEGELDKAVEIKIDQNPVSSDLGQACFNVPRKRQKTGPSSTKISSSSVSRTPAFLPVQPPLLPPFVPKHLKRYLGYQLLKSQG